MYVNAMKIKNYILFHTNIFRDYVPSLLYVYVRKIHAENIVFTSSLQ